MLRQKARVTLTGLPNIRFFKETLLAPIIPKGYVYLLIPNHHDSTNTRDHAAETQV